MSSCQQFRESPLKCENVVGDTGFEPVTSSVSRKRATAAPIAQVLNFRWRWVRDLNPCTRICSPLPRLSANPPCKDPSREGPVERPLRADNETRTRDLNLGKVALYQLSYVRLRFPAGFPAVPASRTLAHGEGRAKTGSPPECCAGRSDEPVPRVRSMRTWIDGRLLEDPRGPALPVTDHGFTVGDGVFEAVKIVDGVPFALSRHLRRLATSAEGLGLPPVDEQEVRRGVAEVLAGEPLPLGRLRHHLHRGCCAPGQRPRGRRPHPGRGRGTDGREPAEPPRR